GGLTEDRLGDGLGHGDGVGDHLRRPALDAVFRGHCPVDPGAAGDVRGHRRGDGEGGDARGGGAQDCLTVHCGSELLLPDARGRAGSVVVRPSAPQLTRTQSWQPVVLNTSPLLTVTMPLPARLSLAMIELMSPEESLSRSQ